MPSSLNATMTKPQGPLPPPVAWAQRRSAVILTFNVEDCVKPEIKIESDKLYFKGVGGSRAEQKDYENTLQLYGKIDPEKSKYFVKDRNVQFILLKKSEGPGHIWWPHLLKQKIKYHWLKVDFTRWKDEDDSEDDEAGENELEEMMRHTGGLGGGGSVGGGGSGREGRPTLENLKGTQRFLLDPTLYMIKGIAILDNDGNRLLAKYYDPTVFTTVKEERKFEKNLFQKTHRANAEIIMLDRLTCVYRSNVDLFFYVMGSQHENELILVSVLSCLYDAVSAILRKNVEKRTMMDNLDIIMLAMDEICDGGVPLETDPQVVAQRVALRMDESPFNDQTVTQQVRQKLETTTGAVLQSAREQLKWSLLK